MTFFLNINVNCIFNVYNVFNCIRQDTLALFLLHLVLFNVCLTYIVFNVSYCILQPVEGAARVVVTITSTAKPGRGRANAGRTLHGCIATAASPATYVVPTLLKDIFKAY